MARLPGFVQNFLIKREWLLYSLPVAAAGSLLKRHTPNYGWCQIYPDLQSILDRSHIELFEKTFGSVLRPSLHIEKALGHMCGMGCVNAYYYLVYFVFLFVSISFLCAPLLELAKKKREGFYERIKVSFSRSILFSLPIYLIVFSGGSIVDAIYPASVIVIVAFLGNREVLSEERKRLKLHNVGMIFSVAFAAFLADMSRPYAPFILLMLLAAAAAQKNLKVLLGLVIGILLSVPYHSIQFSATGSPMLTNYTGCNLMEVYKPDGLVAPGGMKDTPQLVIAERCKQNEEIIKSYVLKKPLSAIKDFLYFPRLSRSAFPAPFTPWKYDGLPSVSNFEEFLQWSLWIALIIFLYIPLIGAFAFSLASGIGSSPSSALVLISVLLPYVITIATNGGQEAGRVGLAFLLPICFVSAKELFWKMHKRL